jgi:hypothetical protein
MKATKLIGIGFALIAAVVGAGAVALTGANATQTGPRPLMLDILGLAWMFLLWGGLVTISVFLIAWVAEGMAAVEQRAARREDIPSGDLPRRESGGHSSVAA